MARKSDPTPLPDLVCACASIRRAARLVTQLYGHEMGRKMEPTQFAVLSALNRKPGARQSSLGRILGLDKTTMSRNLGVMHRNGWIEPARAEDPRERGYRLTRPGRKILAATHPAWARAQAKLRERLRPGEWETMMRLVDRVSQAAIAANQY
jgi:DNA-binding MarR family transcriptional regulator